MRSSYLLMWICLALTIMMPGLHTLQLQGAEPELAPSSSSSSSSHPSSSLSSRQQEWGEEWSEPSTCSRTCGVGVQYREKKCMKTPQDAPCDGPSRIYMSCSTQDCLEGSKDFRLEQCEKYNSVKYSGTDEYHEWVPYYSVASPCELLCLAKGQNFFVRLAARVTDGTPCRSGSADVCVEGTCQALGCDLQLGSGKVNDVCGVCGGDGSTCHAYSGILSTHSLEMGYNDVLLLPAGSTSIEIHEESHSNNYIALRNSKGDFYLNHDWQIQGSRSFEAAGVTFQYSREGHQEILSSDGPTTETIFVMVIRQQGHGAQFRYAYAVPKEQRQPRARRPGAYHWETGDWAPCNQTCAGGEQSREVVCINSQQGGDVSADLCDATSKPSSTQACNEQHCPANWGVGEWTECSSTCGRGWQFRTVQCERLHPGRVTAVTDSAHCTGTKPASVHTCNEYTPCPSWEIGAWSKCNTVCGPGKQFRPVLCRAHRAIGSNNSTVLSDSRCDIGEKSTNQKDCHAGPCGGVEWITSQWAECHGSCQVASQSRQVVCSTDRGEIHPDGMCDPGKKPDSRITCSRDDCEAHPLWYASQWGHCSSKCGAGVQHRAVVCALQTPDDLQRVSDADCDPDLKLTSEQACNGTQCYGVWFAGPFGKCSEACGGGQKKRQVLCFAEGQFTTATVCDGNDKPSVFEDCHQQPCDDDNLIVVGGCKGTQFGCCPDGISSAEGPANHGCPAKDRIPTGLCIESDYGCCIDGITPADGPFGGGCPKYTCLDTMYGCCEDGHTPSGGRTHEGCPIFHGCQNSAFGCCPDGITFANGFNQEGCEVVPHTCHQAAYGCCKDDVTFAQGPFLAGCGEDVTVEEGSGEAFLPQCKDTQYGCCDDDITAASGPHKRGCSVIGRLDCDASLYGCCPDGHAAADGPGYQGCPGVVVPEKSGCAETMYGCCPDGVMAALAPGHAGCDKKVEGVDCQNTIFGCCPDGFSVAHGGTDEGCPSVVGGCAGTYYGCCPDGATAAHGLAHAGCPGVTPVADCENTVYGCCPDGVKMAEGWLYEGCDVVHQEVSCDAALYGCCLDGVSVAVGPQFQGCPVEGSYETSCSDGAYGCCPDGETAAIGPNAAGCPGRRERGAACALNSERGPCGNYSVKWFFDPSYGDCSRFWHGGCEGNANRFDTKDECRSQCAKPEDPLDRCYLPKSVGRCRASMQVYFYSPETQQCEQFVYGGCHGNDNRFSTVEKCNKACVEPHKPDVCSQPQSTGPCRGHFPRWFFDRTTGRCRQFSYGGCQGNDNKFDSEALCEERCMRPAAEVCRLPVDAGPCNATALARWHFDAQSSQCQEFVYGGCQGNSNRFPTQAECEQKCRELIKTKDVDVCTLPEDSGPCEAYFERWFYDPKDAFCKQFVYGGCQGNDNRFETEQQCRQSCNAKPPVDVCTLPMEAGPCKARMLRFYFDGVTAICRQFVYGGCNSNGNNFETVEECEKTCSRRIPTKQPTDLNKRRCFLPMDMGPCLALLPRWHYDFSDQLCHPFDYGGCEGNRNRFLTEAACLEMCGEESTGHEEEEAAEHSSTTSTSPSSTATTPHVTPSTSDVCGLTSDSGPCYAYNIAWFYDRSTQECRRFHYGGCGGNGNRFDSREACERRCFLTDICSLLQDSGECLGYIQSWYYDKQADGCKQFVYGGCGGNGNRFQTQADCENKCRVSATNATGLEVCALNSLTGPCKAAIPRWYYDLQKGECASFAYGGCRGNENNFLSQQECKNICPPAEVCKLPSSVGPCRAAKTRYFFNTVSGQCEEFTYGGCDGNANRFLTLESCQQVCAGAEKGSGTTKVTAPASPATSPSNGHVRTTTTTTTTTTTRLPTERQATTTPHTQHADVCSMQKHPGDCDDYAPVWYFEPISRTCRRFLYGGCGGNANRYATREDCHATCLEPKTTTTTTVATTTRFVVTNAPAGGSTEVPSGEQAVEYHLCMLEMESGECGNTLDVVPESGTRWYYNASSGTCFDFEYTGCGGNANNFPAFDICLNLCGPETVVRVDSSHRKGTDVCAMRQDTGPCQAHQLRWYFDQSQGRCLQFQYGGCQGNLNNFKSETECQDICGAGEVVEKPKTRDVCRLQQETGPCFADFLRYFFDESLGECRPFAYGGCQGNENNFETQEECYATCVDQPQDYLVYEPGDCYKMADAGPCEAAEARYYFDSNLFDCQPFYYGGCDGNGNNFRAYDDCFAFCSKVTETCGVLQCNLDCPQGFSRGPHGCLECKCLDQCEGHVCADDEECVLEEVVCIRSPCPGHPVCKTKPKPGKCPDFSNSSLNTAVCITECSQDEDCSASAKCCFNGCGHICVVPDMPDCTSTVFGCCPDGKIVAKGWNYHGCPEEAPMIAGHALEVVGIEGGTVTIPCHAKGAPLPQISWYKSRFPIEEESDEDTRLIVLEDGSLQILEVQTDDANAYTCRAFNNIGSATKTYTLIVTVPPTIKETKTDHMVAVGDTVQLECIATGTPEPSVRWFHGDQLVTIDNKHMTQDDEGMLMIKGVGLEDDGEFMCEITNGVGEPLKKAFHVNVLGPVSVRMAAHNATYNVGEDMRLLCITEGDVTNVELMWLKEGAPLVFDDRMKETEEGELLIEDLVKDDSGEYTCTANRGDEEQASVSARVEVNGVELATNCTDKPWYANCQLIIQARLCRHPYFSVFCCKSCHEAGHLP